jgi:hypothetical protein
VPQFEKLKSKGNFVPCVTVVAAKEVGAIGSGDGPERRSAFVTDPTTGALVLRPDLEPKFERTLAAELRRLKLRIYLDLAFLYLAKFRFETLGLLHKTVRYCQRLLH